MLRDTSLAIIHWTDSIAARSQSRRIT